MNKKTAAQEWRTVMRLASAATPGPRDVHAFAQRVEAITISACDKRHTAALREIGQNADAAILRALKELSDMYVNTWDRVDGALVMQPPGVDRFEAAHARARKLLEAFRAT